MEEEREDGLLRTNSKQWKLREWGKKILNLTITNGKSKKSRWFYITENKWKSQGFQSATTKSEIEATSCFSNGPLVSTNLLTLSQKRSQQIWQWSWKNFVQRTYCSSPMTLSYKKFSSVIMTDCILFSFMMDNYNLTYLYREIAIFQ